MSTVCFQSPIGLKSQRFKNLLFLDKTQRKKNISRKKPNHTLQMSLLTNNNNPENDGYCDAKA
jgi:hypothetical protein